MKIAISGASGKTGYRITEEAVKKGYKVRQIIRKTSKVSKGLEGFEKIRISLDDKNLDSLSNDLASILKFVEQLNKLDTNNVKPLNSIVDKSLEPRKDQVNDGKIKEEILRNSPDKNEDFFIVPKVVE